MVLARDGMKYIALLSVIVILTALLSGCTGQKQGAQGAATVNPGGSGQPTLNAAGDNRTGQQKINETIASVIADGTYTSNVAYFDHAGQDTVEMSITTKNGVITDASVKPVAVSMMSNRYISEFSSAIPTMVIGKRIDQLNLPHNVAGSSLTSAAFGQYAASLVSKS